MHIDNQLNIGRTCVVAGLLGMSMSGMKDCHSGDPRVKFLSEMDGTMEGAELSDSGSCQELSTAGTTLKHLVNAHEEGIAASESVSDSL